MDICDGILITGGTGLLGLHWAQACKDTAPVTLALHQRTSVPSGVAALPLDLGDPKALDSAFQASKAKLVIHTAGLTSVELCEAEPERAHHENTYIAGQVAAAAARHGAQMVHISTDHLFSDRETLYTESDPVDPINIYGRTKAAAEEHVLTACKDALVLRTNFYGWGPSYRPSFSDWILKNLSDRKPLPLFDDVSYTPILIQVLVSSAMALVERKCSGIFHATGDTVLSKLAFGQAVAKVFGHDPSVIKPTQMKMLPNLVPRPRHMALSNSRLRAELGHGLGTVEDHLELLRTEEKCRAIQEIRIL